MYETEKILITILRDEVGIEKGFTGLKIFFSASLRSG